MGSQVINSVQQILSIIRNFQCRNIINLEKNLSSRWDLNPQPSVIWAGALTTELLETLW